MNAISEQTVREIASANPGAPRVFEHLGIDYCCGGKLSLSAACRRANVPLAEAVEALKSCEGQPELAAPNDAALGDLARYIVERHHTFVRRESPRIRQLLARIWEKHGPAHPELCEVRALFDTMADELAQHMAKEERILFPYIVALDSSAAPRACFDSIQGPIAAMIRDHEDAGWILSRIRALTNGYAAPAGACGAFRASYAALQEFERDLHLHVHQENNILFPRAIAAERERRVAPGSGL